MLNWIQPNDIITEEQTSKKLKRKYRGCNKLEENSLAIPFDINDITGNIEVFLIVGTALIAMGVAALKAVPQITYLHILNLKDSDRLSYDLQKTSIKDKSSFYIIFVAICMIATLSFVLTSYISMQIDSPFLMWLLGVIFSILVICYYIYLKKCRKKLNL